MGDRDWNAPGTQRIKKAEGTYSYHDLVESGLAQVLRCGRLPEEQQIRQEAVKWPRGLSFGVPMYLRVGNKQSLEKRTQDKTLHCETLQHRRSG